MRILKRLGDSQTAGFGLVQRFQQYFIFQYVSFGTGQRLSQNLAKEEKFDDYIYCVWNRAGKDKDTSIKGRGFVGLQFASNRNRGLSVRITMMVNKGPHWQKEKQHDNWNCKHLT